MLLLYWSVVPCKEMVAMFRVVLGPDHSRTLWAEHCSVTVWFFPVHVLCFRMLEMTAKMKKDMDVLEKQVLNVILRTVQVLPACGTNTRCHTTERRERCMYIVAVN